MNFTTRKPDGALYSILADGGIRLLGGTLGVADGFEWSLDDTEMHFTVTAEKTIYRGPFRLGNWTMSGLPPRRIA